MNHCATYTSIVPLKNTILTSPRNRVSNFQSCTIFFWLFMAPNREALIGNSNYTKNDIVQKPSAISTEALQRTISDVSLELISREGEVDDAKLSPVSEVEEAQCECCGMSEECTPAYISQVRSKFSGKLVCGLCGEAVKEEMERNGGKREEALNEHMSVCLRFNRFGKAYPVLYQVEAVRELFKKSSRLDGETRACKSASTSQNKGSIGRSSSCIPAITSMVSDRKMVKGEVSKGGGMVADGGGEGTC